MTGNRLIDADDILTTCAASLNGLHALLCDANTGAPPEMGEGIWAVIDMVETNAKRVERASDLIDSELAERRKASQAAR
ncbi:hypothetical protein [Collinsella ihumii]|uniref:Uncharacterized protein n=1 Tax=Collinsella ihumii TaxID=1720204 RepID=A0ABT7XDN7_9ACTN|nr:hypothetical protein [Collinsella ihumii]MDN0063518.1 hypothetical protein [Collinsella ihumii]